MSIVDLGNKLYSGNYKRLMILPIVLFIIYLILIFVYPGITAGIDLKGGTMLMVKTDKQINSDELKSTLLQKFSLDNLNVTSVSSPTGTTGVIVEFAKNETFYNADLKLKTAKSVIDSNPNEAVIQSNDAIALVTSYYVPTDKAPIDPKQMLEFAKETINKAKENFHAQLQSTIADKYSLGDKVAFQIKEVEPTVGEIFWGNAITVAIIAAILIIIVIFFFFRLLIPSLAIMLCAIFDLLSGLIGMVIFNVPLSLSTIPALLLLVGYSIDTDILLTTKVLKGTGDTTNRQRSAQCLKTGLTMTGTALGAVAVMMVFAYFNQMFVIYEISVVMFTGLIGDIIGTWLLNAPLLIWYADKREKKESR